MPQSTPFALDSRISLQGNVEQLLATHLSRRLSSAEATVVGEQLEEALSLLKSGGRASHRALLDQPLLTALATPGAALLWGAALETLAERGTESIQSLLANVVEAAGVISAAVFSNAALGL